MNKYVIKAAKHGINDPFGFKEASEHLYFFAAGLKDLRDTIRCITPQGYRVCSARWFSKSLKYGEAKMRNPLLRTTMYEIRQVKNDLEIEQELDWNNEGFKHRLKIVSSDNWL